MASLVDCSSVRLLNDVDNVAYYLLINRKIINYDGKKKQKKQKRKEKREKKDKKKKKPSTRTRNNNKNQANYNPEGILCMHT